MKPDDEFIEEVLKHVGLEHIPDTLDRAELSKDILIAWEFFQSCKYSDSSPVNSARRKYAEQIASVSQKLIDLLGDQNDAAQSVRGILARQLQNIGRDLTYLPDDLARLSSLAGDVVAQSYIPSSWAEVLGTSPAYWFLGHDLPAIFEKHFQQRAVRSRKDGALDGPFIRFATAITAELGDPSLDETVSKAMTTVQKIRE